MKTEGSLAVRAKVQAKVLLLLVLACMAIVSLWTPLAFERIALRWFSLPNILFLWWVPAATALVAFAEWRWLKTGREVAAVPRHHRALPIRLSWAFDLKLPLSRSTISDDLADGSGSRNPGLHVDGNAGVIADHYRLHDIRLLGL